VLLHIELDAIVYLGRPVGELSGQGQDHADLERLLGVRGGGREYGGKGAQGELYCLTHESPPKSMMPKSGYRFSENIMLQQDLMGGAYRRAPARGNPPGVKSCRLGKRPGTTRINPP
jgi:hypothetical protein